MHALEQTRLLCCIILPYPSRHCLQLPLSILTRGFREAGRRRRLRAAIRELEKEEQTRMAEIEALINRQRRLKRQIDSLRTVRQMMAWWHTLHVPLGLTLFGDRLRHPG